MSRNNQRRYQVALCTIHVHQQWVVASSEEQAEALAKARYDEHGLSAFELAFYEVDHFQITNSEEIEEVQL